MTSSAAMRILAAPDKFRGTATAGGAAAAIAAAAATVGAVCQQLPLADGGEGTVEALGGANRTTTVTGPLGDPVTAAWRFDSADTGAGVGPRAVIEMAAASGLLLAGGTASNDPAAATTRGTGELIAAALAEGAREVWVGVGGSATTDGGAGALEILAPSGVSIIPSNVELTVLTDVNTVFERAAEVFGPQKGASPQQVVMLTERLHALRMEYRRQFGVDIGDLPGSGAAGGLAGALAALGARLVDGFTAVADAARLEAALDEADLVITGEGRFDATSLAGKVVGGVLERARARGVPVWVIAGAVDRAAPTGGADTVISLTEKFGKDIARHRTIDAVTRAVSAALSAMAHATTSDRTT